MFKKIIAFVLVFSFSMSIISSAFASEVTDFSEEALRVSDEFVAQYPSGMFGLSAVSIEANEYSGRSVIKVTRQGGTSGNISVKLKAIDISTKYGQDYSLSIPGFIFDKKIEGTATTAAAFSVIGYNENGTMPASISGTVQTEVTSTAISVKGPTEEVVIDAPNNSGLKAVRQQATGKTSDREKLALPNSEEQEKINTATAAADNFYDEAPGTVFSLSFADGERVKSFNLDILNDDIAEAQEQIIFVITEVTAGGVIGLQKETTINILDDEPYEVPVFGFTSHSFKAEGESAKITLTRTAGENYYAGASISTFGDSARAGTEYTELGQKILFVPGQTELSIEIPVVKNESGVDKYFYVRLEPDNGCTISGDEVVQVLIPKQEQESSNVVQLLSKSTLQAAAVDVMLGVSQDIINYNKLVYAGGTDQAHFVHSQGWYEVNLNGRNTYGSVKTPKDYYMGNLESVYSNIELFNLGYRNGYNAARIQGQIFEHLIISNSMFKVDKYINVSDKNLAYGKNKSEITIGNNVHKLKKDIYRKDFGIPIPKSYLPIKLELKVSTPFKSDKAAMRVYSVEVNYRKFEFNVIKPKPFIEHTFDFKNKTKTEENVTPGEIEITTLDKDPKHITGFYTSEDTTSFNVRLKNAIAGYHLTGLKFLANIDGDKDYTFDLTETHTITITPEWLLKNASNYSKDGMFSIQPVFERKKASLTVSMSESDKNKGEITNVINSKTPVMTYTKDITDKYDLYENDKVILTGIGNTGTMVQGYNVSYNRKTAVSESGSQDAGIHTITLKEKVDVSPIFGKQSLNIFRDPDNKNKFKDIQGTLTFGAQTTTQAGQLNNIQSGQIVDFISIPPEGYTTQWANRTGDKDGDGVLDYGEIYDSNGKLYRQYDYDVDGKLDAEYDAPLFGDLFSYKVNQPNPLFYYYYVPMALQTTFSGTVSGSVVTREYSIRKGYIQVADANGEKVDKLVPVAGAEVKMGGSYNKTNPDAQIGYGSSTTSLGRFDFNVANLIKNAYYFLGVDYNGVSYVDKINPSSAKQLILPTFTSMKPISINAVPQGGEDTNVVSGSVVMLKDKTVNFSLVTASLENNIKVEKAIFKIYSSNGTLVSQETQAVVGDRTVFSANLNNAFTPNAKLTVQLVDQNGNQSMEYNCGFQFRPPMQATSLLPAFAAPNEKPIPLIESVMGVLDMGFAKFTNMTVNDDGYTLYIGKSKDFEEKSKELKNTIDAAVDDGADSKAAKDKIKEENKDAPKKEDSNIKVKSTLTNNLNVRVSLEMIIKYDESRDSSLGSPYYFGSLKLIVTLQDKLKSETRVVLPIGLSVVLSLEVGGSVTGYINITPHEQPDGSFPKVYADQYGNFPYTDSDQKDRFRKFDVEGGVILEPHITLGIKAEYGVAAVSVSGTATFKLIFSTKADANKGTVTLDAEVEVTSLGFRVFHKSYNPDDEYKLFGKSSELVSQMLEAETINQSNFESVSRDYLNSRSSWLGDVSKLKTGSSTVTDFTEKTLMQGIYTYPDTQLMRIDEDSLLMVFVDDHEVRTDENRGAVYYCVSHDNGATFSEPVLLDDDGTLDSSPCLKDVGSRIVCLYSSLDENITEEMSMEKILEANSLEMAFFDKSTYQFTQPIDVTKYTGREDPADGRLLGDYHSDVDGNAVYDEESGQLLIMYTKTDHTSDLDENLDATDLFDSYGAIAYMLYDTNTDSFLPYGESDYPAGLTTEAAIQWNKDWYGQRFLDTEIIDDSLPGGVLSDPLVLDLTTAEKDGTVYIAYTVDSDGDMGTLEDREIYLQTYNFNTKTFTDPLKVSEMESEIQSRADGKSKLVLYNGEMYLFYSADTAIYYYDLEDLFAKISSMDPAASLGEENYESLAPRIALKYSESNLPSDDYKVLVGDDGKLYLIWTEGTMRLTEGVELGSQAASKPENLYHESQIYASVLYEKKVNESVDKEAIEINDDYGTWSEKVQITAGPGSYDDFDASIMGNGHIILTAKKSEKILLNDSETSPRIDNPDNAKLVALTLTPIAQGSMDKDSITFKNEYPIPNEVTKITALVGNHGLMPLIDPAVDFYAVQGETETFIGTGNSSTPVYGGSQAAVGVNWTVPEKLQDIKIVAKLRSGDSQTIIAQSEKAFPYGTKFEYGLFDVEYVAKNNYITYIEAHHKGNQKLENAELVISRIDADKKTHELKRLSIDNETAALEMFVINESFEIPQEDLKEGCTDIEVRIESSGNLLVKQTTTVEKELLSLYQELVDQVTSVELPYTELALTSGNKSTITAKAYPVEADEKNNIVYVSSNPAVATVNDAGEITGLLSGSATVTAYAVPKVDVSTQTEDGHAINGSILDTLALEDCKSDALTVTVKDNSSNGTSSIPIENKAPGSVNIYANSDKPVSITVNGYTVELSQKAIAEILNGEQSKTLTVSVTALDANEKAQLYAISIKQGDTSITSIKNADLRISIPYTLKENENSNAVVVYSVTGSGELKAIPNGRYKDGRVTFTTSDLTKFGIGYNLQVFTDVDKKAWYADAVSFIAARGIAAGIGENQFAPGKLMTREEFAKFIVSAFGFSWSGDKTGFSDVTKGSWYEQYVGALYEAGIISGTGNGRFGTKEYITRQDMARILYAAIQKSGIILNKTRQYVDFDDDSNITGYATEAIKALYEAGIINGIGNNKLEPTANAPRSNMAAIIKKVLELN